MSTGPDNAGRQQGGQFEMASFIRAAKGLTAEEMGRFAREAAFAHRALAEAGTAEAQP